MRSLKYLPMFSLLIITAVGMSFATAASVRVASDIAKPIVVKKSNPVFEITLESNPSTGYAWFLKKHNTKLLKSVKHKYYPTRTGLIGSGGFDVWSFEAKSQAFTVPQTTDISLIYSRYSDQEEAKINTFKVIFADDN